MILRPVFSALLNILKMWFLSLLLLVVVMSDFTTGNNFDDENCKILDQIDETEYDLTPESVHNISSRPLGYVYALIPFGDNKNTTNNNSDVIKNACFVVSLNDSSKQTVEILAKSIPVGRRFCVKAEPAFVQPTCQAGVKSCQDSAIGYNKIKFVFYCPDCEADLPIWIRLNASPFFTSGLEFENWCQRSTRYPDDLVSHLTPKILQLSTKPPKIFQLSTKAPKMTVPTKNGANSSKKTMFSSTNTISSINTTSNPGGNANFLVPCMPTLAGLTFSIFVLL